MAPFGRGLTAQRACRDVLSLCAEPPDYCDTPPMCRPGPRIFALVLRSFESLWWVITLKSQSDLGIFTSWPTCTGHRYGLLRAWVRVGNFPPAKNPYPWGGLCGLPRVFFSRPSPLLPLPTTSSDTMRRLYSQVTIAFFSSAPRVQAHWTSSFKFQLIASH